jgi:response regulator of citrate/malate metabolism
VIRTLIVEDDPILAEVHRTYTERVIGFTVVAVVQAGGEALRFLDRHPVDLVLLDFYLPDMGGLDVCRAIRTRGHATDVMAVTSARRLETVRAAVSLGVVQYLLKPFTFDSFRDKLERYARYRSHVTSSTTAVAQHDVDQAFAALRGPGGDTLPKGLSADTLVAVVETLRKAPEMRSATEIGEALGVSRITARRYLEHLADQDLVSRHPRYGGPGRPEFGYRWQPGASTLS